MSGTNQSSVSEFLLLGLSRQPQQQHLLFVLFLSMYLATVLRNLLIILAVSTDSHLHTPMYFFLSNLSFVDVCFSSTTVPKISKPTFSCLQVNPSSLGLGVSFLAHEIWAQQRDKILKSFSSGGAGWPCLSNPNFF
uniref:G-protein coupled receptors family 1 profile domain-containing protein n=1 Tax=Cercocebus atys TaxID=9531 RepID=A0A2K5MCP6_CERAT